MTEEAGHTRATRCEIVSPETRVDFELILRYAAAQQARLDAEAERLLAGHPREPRSQAIASRSADTADVDRVRAVVEKAGLTAGGVDLETRRIAVSGPAARVNALFRITLETYTAATGSWRDFEGTFELPPELQGVVVAVLGLSTKAVAFRE